MMFYSYVSVMMFFSLSNGQRAGLPQARDAGPELQEQRGHPGDLRQVQDIQARRIRQVRIGPPLPQPPAAK